VAKRVIATDDGAGRRRQCGALGIQVDRHRGEDRPPWQPARGAYQRDARPGPDRCRLAARDLDQFPGPWPPARSRLSSDGDQLSGGKAAEYR
jgi:hypothetical protein